MGEERRPVGWSPRFLRALADEIARCEKRIDGLDRRIERAVQQAAKDRLSEQRATWVAYERFLRGLLR